MSGKLPLPIRLVVGIISRIVWTVVISALTLGGLYFYMNHDADFKQKVFSNLAGIMQDACTNMQGSNVDMRSMNFRNLDLKAMANTMLSDAPEAEKKAQMQQIGQAVAADNQDALKQTIMSHGVSEAEAEKALTFQPTMVKYSIPLQLAPFAYAIKDRPNAEKFYTAFHVRNVGPQGAGAIPLLTNAIKGKDALLREAAKASLKLIGTPEALAALKQDGKP